MYSVTGFASGSSMTAVIGGPAELNGACLFACRADDDRPGKESKYSVPSIPLFETRIPLFWLEGRAFPKYRTFSVHPPYGEGAWWLLYLGAGKKAKNVWEASALFMKTLLNSFKFLSLMQKPVRALSTPHLPFTLGVRSSCFSFLTYLMIFCTIA